LDLRVNLVTILKKKTKIPHLAESGTISPLGKEKNMCKRNEGRRENEKTSCVIHEILKRVEHSAHSTQHDFWHLGGEATGGRRGL